MVDVLNHPRYGVSLTLALDALLLATERGSDFLDRLLNTVVRFDSPAAARRVGLVVERLFGTEEAEPFRGLIGMNRAPVLLRAHGPASGPLVTAWRVILNETESHESVHRRCRRVVGQVPLIGEPPQDVHDLAVNQVRRHQFLFAKRLRLKITGQNTRPEHQLALWRRPLSLLAALLQGREDALAWHLVADPRSTPPSGGRRALRINARAESSRRTPAQIGYRERSRRSRRSTGNAARTEPVRAMSPMPTSTEIRPSLDQ